MMHITQSGGLLTALLCIATETGRTFILYVITRDRATDSNEHLCQELMSATHGIDYPYHYSKVHALSRVSMPLLKEACSHLKPVDCISHTNLLQERCHSTDLNIQQKSLGPSG